jgi:hypothetical protein
MCVIVCEPMVISGSVASDRISSGDMGVFSLQAET